MEVFDVINLVIVLSIAVFLLPVFTGVFQLYQNTTTAQQPSHPAPQETSTLQQVDTVNTGTPVWIIVFIGIVIGVPLLYFVVKNDIQKHKKMKRVIRR